MVTGLAKETQISFPLESTGLRTFEQIVIYPGSGLWSHVDTWLEELSYVTVEGAVVLQLPL